MKNSIKLEAFHFNVSSNLQWLWGHSSPNIFYQSIFHFLRHSRNDLSYLEWDNDDLSNQ